MAEVICPICGGEAWLVNDDDDIWCSSCESAKAEAYGDAQRENKMFVL